MKFNSPPDNPFAQLVFEVCQRVCLWRKYLKRTHTFRYAQGLIHYIYYIYTSFYIIKLWVKISGMILIYLLTIIIYMLKFGLAIMSWRAS